jgi:uncharacterized protein (DUF1810 family)
MDGALVTQFLDAQNSIYPDVLRELRIGAKRTHWMWFIFPQIGGLGSSEMARRFALPGLEAARDYLAHPILGGRLRECTSAVLLHGPDGPAPRTLSEIFGHPDDLKFGSSMTLFHRAAPEEELFGQALDAFFGGEEDAETLKRL